MRGIVVTQLLSNKRVYSFRSIREEETALMVEKIQNSFSMNSPLDLSDMFPALTNNVACRVALGRKYGGGEGGRKFKEMLGEFVRLLGGFNVADLIPWFGWMNRLSGLDAQVERMSKQFDSFLEEVVHQHVNRRNENIDGSDGREVGEEQQKDFVDVLLGIQKDNATGLTLDRTNVKALLLVSIPSLSFVVHLFKVYLKHEKH